MRLVPILIAFLFPVAAGAASAQSGAVLTHAAAREGQDLSGSWTYSIDPSRDGLYGFHGSPAGEGHQRFDPRDVEAVIRERPEALFEYDMRRAARTTLPGSWTGHDPELRHYEGLVWYDRAFEANLEDDERAFLHIGAANYTARVYVNGELVGTHRGGFTPFAFEVTDRLVDGENRVTLGVDSARDETSIPSPVTDWETYGGITRPVRLVIVPETFIDEAWVRMTQEGRIAATVALDGPEAAQRPVAVRVPELDLTLQGSTNRNGVFEAEAPAPERLRRWSPEAPRLYDVQIEAGADSLPERVGFRTIEVRGEKLLLNGEPIFLRGICMHEEELGRDPARAITEAAARALLTEIKDGLNANFVRLAHYPHAETTVRLADEMGLLVWSEIPVYWRIAWENDEALATARTMLEENVRRDRNRASVILWSVGNETPVGEQRNAFLRRLIADVRRLDDTRLVTAALLTEFREQDGELLTRITDPLTADLDVMAVNAYHGWYGPLPVERVSEVRWQSEWNKPLIFSEFGAGALAGFHDPDSRQKFSEEYQAEIYRETLEMAEGVPFLQGMSPWILKDFRSPRRQHPVYQQGWNRKGLISETGERKEAFGVLADFYEEMEAER
ncbi:glycoside hydrolase family 2 protein [Parvularcula oceani]|uniref:glycoside hydrolase family 2 protein n=1 Tax=Parvularcula oceani TaxID=1247963 RepID=UPI0005678E65|nr:glycoside hydrolase family 2 TIM barrel-domain containing protein [Parvularcula oceani]